MSNPTLIALIAAFSISILVFLVAAVVRALKNPGRSEEISLTTDATISPPPPLPLFAENGVATRFYTPLDFVMAAFILLVFGGLGITSATAKTEMADYTVAAIVASIILQFTLAAVTTGFMMWRIRPVEWLGLRWQNYTGEQRAFWLLLCVPLLTGLLLGCLMLLNLIGYMKWMESLGVEVTQDAVKILQNSTDWNVLILMALAATVVAPICEEIIFRGFLFPVAKRYAGTAVAVFSSSLIFAAAHGSLAALGPLFLVGALLAIVYNHTKSLWVPIAIHCAFNSFTVIVQFAVRANPQLLEQLNK